jgi:hypothetical protein
MQQDDRILRTMRAMEWSRIKGMLDAILNTYWSEEEKHNKLDKLIHDFIGKVDGEGLAE